MFEKTLEYLNSFVEDKRGETISFIIALFLVLLIGAILIVTVAGEVATATADANITGTIAEDILDLWPFLFCLVPVIIIVKYIG